IEFLGTGVKDPPHIYLRATYLALRTLHGDPDRITYAGVEPRGQSLPQDHALRVRAKVGAGDIVQLVKEARFRGPIDPFSPANKCLVAVDERGLNRNPGKDALNIRQGPQAAEKGST